MKSRNLLLCSLFAAFGSSCSPLKSSPNDEKHQLELTLHAVQTNLDDVKHDNNCFQTELQILDGRIKYYENALTTLKQNELEKQQKKLDALSEQILNLEQRFASLEKKQQTNTKGIYDLSTHANETTAALSQFKDRINEMEQEILSQNTRYDELMKLKASMDQMGKSKANYKIYKVKPGDSLKKIAKAHKTAIDKIKKFNDLDHDLIVVGQELKIPTE